MPGRPQRALIASSHSLFGQGLLSLFRKRHADQVEVVGMAATLEEALAAIDQLDPDLVIVDYDDETLNRDEFLARFVEGEKKLRLVLLSLAAGEEALVYDRRSMAASQVDAWLEEWSATPGGATPGAPAAHSKSHRRKTMKHLILAGILVILVTAALILGLDKVTLLPTAASAQALPIDSMFRLEFIVIAFLFALIVVFMLYSILVFRRKSGDATDAVHMTGNTRLEVVWTIVPLITVLTFSYLGARSLAETQRIDPKALEVEVTGSQWSWRFDYPEWGITSSELMLPVNRQVVLHLSSTDVIHSFWVPEFRVKQDALPGGEVFVRDLRVTPTQTGSFKVRCAELCGLQHAYMESPVVVVSQADFDAWVASQTGLPDDPVLRGAKWAKGFGCAACHSIDGSQGVGPTWKGLYGHQVTMEDGSVVTVDDAYIIESIRVPGARIVQGYANIMPANIGQDLSDAQIADIIQYIQSLK